MKSFYITTLGCKVNQYESDGIAGELAAHGWQKRHHSEGVDICIINTCTVTARAAQQSRQEIRHIIRSNPQACVIVTGCHAQTAAQEIARIKAVDHIIGHKNKFNIARAIINAFSPQCPPSPAPVDGTGDPSDAVPELQRHTGDGDPPLSRGFQGIDALGEPVGASCTAHAFHSFPPAVTGDHTRAYLKIQDGCNAFCTYCIVPHARGRSCSMPMDEVMAHLMALHDKGIAEAILTGIHIGAYGLDLEEKSSLEALLQRIAAEKPIHRVRLSSVEPRELTDGIINLICRHDIFCDHFHIPLQSGDDDILSRMKRPYTSALFKSLVMKIRRKMPHAAIGVDILQGFPGETEEAFKNTLGLIQSLPITYLHVFPFSPREGTPAFDFPDPVPRDVVRERCSIMRSLGARKAMEFQHRNMGRTLDAVIQDQTDPETGQLKAVTGNYLTIHVTGGNDLKKKPVKVTLDRVEKEHLMGHVI